jgi:hypothetical protein
MMLGGLEVPWIINAEEEEILLQQWRDQNVQIQTQAQDLITTLRELGALFMTAYQNLVRLQAVSTNANFTSRQGRGRKKMKTVKKCNLEWML